MPAHPLARPEPPGLDWHPLSASIDLASEDESPPRPRDEWDDWYDRYAASAPTGKLDMVRALLAEDRPAAFYADLEFVSLILELPRDLGPDSDATYLTFLEELLTWRPDVFALGAGWFAQRMSYAYVKAGRECDIARVVPCLVDEAHEPDEPVFDLIDLLRLTGMYEESRALTFATLKKTEGGGFMPWAVNELIEFAVFFLYQEAVEAECTKEAVATLRRRMAEINCDPSEDNLAAMLEHRAGTVERPIELTDLLGRDDRAGFNLYLLSLDFGRWLMLERELPPVVADTLRYFSYVCLGEMNGKSDRNPLILHQKRFDKYLAGLLGFMSVMHLRGVATLIAMGHFVDFIASEKLIDDGQQRRMKRICEGLGQQVQRALGDAASDFDFLNRYR
jgi:hypothetical protein